MYIHVRVTADANREKVFKVTEDHFDIWVKEKAEGNRANDRMLEIISDHFKVPKYKVRIVNGHHHPSKLLVIDEEKK